LIERVAASAILPRLTAFGWRYESLARDDVPKRHRKVFAHLCTSA